MDIQTIDKAIERLSFLLEESNEKSIFMGIRHMSSLMTAHYYLTVDQLSDRNTDFKEV